MNDKHPDHNEVGNAGNGVPAPLLWSALSAECSEETGQDHDEIGNDSEQDAASVHSSEKSKIQKEEGSGKTPVDITCPVDLAVDVVLGVWDVLVRLADGDVVVADTVAGGHGEVRESSGGGDKTGDDVIETLALGRSSALMPERHGITGSAYHWDVP